MSPFPFTLQLDDPAPDLTFSSVEEVLDWISDERNAWSWLQSRDELPGLIRNLDFDVFTALDQYRDVFHRLRDSPTHENYISSAIAHLNALNTKPHPWHFTQTPAGQAVLLIKDTLGPGPGAGAYLMQCQQLSGQTFNTTWLGNRDILRGVLALVMPDEPNPKTLAGAWAEQRAKAMASVRTSLNTVKGEINAQREKWAQHLITAQDQHQSAVAAFASRTDADIADWTARATELEARLRNLEETYRVQMQLQAPVAYWSKKRADHEDSLKAARDAVGLFFLATGIALIAALGIVAWKAPAIAEIAKTFSPSFLVLLSGLFAGLTTIVFWGGRLLTRNYLSLKHLINDAREREVMASTYLALTNEAAAVDSDKAIILSALFRPTSDGIVSDEGPSEAGAAQLLARLLSSQSGR